MDKFAHFPPTDAELLEHYSKRIQALRAENERLRAALEQLKTAVNHSHHTMLRSIIGRGQEPARDDEYQAAYDAMLALARTKRA